jgi:prepilin-type processing-associated H-X9-DG protein
VRRGVVPAARRRAKSRPRRRHQPPPKAAELRAVPYPNQAAADKGYILKTKMNPGFAVAADLNPGVAGKNSRNHEGRGQNVLYADNHVEWTDTPKCGLNQDDIYSNKAGVVQASPVDPTDSVLLPVD